MSNEVNISEFYPASSKQMIYKHNACGYFWIQKGFTAKDPSFCSKCRSVIEEALAGYPTLDEAQQHHTYLLYSKHDEIMQIRLARAINTRIDELEKKKMQEKKIYEGKEVKSTFLDGSFYEKWLNWTNINWPNTEMIGCNKWKNGVQNKNFGPRLDERKPLCEATTADMFMNISISRRK
ncbi:hypothetical protein CAEBREN_24718 [Caenorhabditis brenneri]|uniref:Uncharacterized protein n=1 Tax=Caenorhabditis brenneri TaxID=135651 RepID=G0NMU5_CAEBE|nr:hypothetical protein CAEBREN_24718 [Caenorhabditis brenneri]